METQKQQAPSRLITVENHRIYLAAKKRDQRSHTEGNLVLDGPNIGTYESADALWSAFQQTPARLVITERRFGQGFTGLDLVRAIRRDYLLPYVYIVALSSLSGLKDIKEGLAAGVDIISSSRRIRCNSAPAFWSGCVGCSRSTRCTRRRSGPAPDNS